jgi:ABC-type antimicrobial peptide transport system permease subunit
MNEAARRLMGIINPVGLTIPWRPDGNDRGTFTVIGVFKDMVKGSPYAPADPSIVFLSDKTEEWLYIRIRPEVSAAEAIQGIQPVFNNLFPSAPFDYKFVSETYDAKFRTQERIAKLAAVFSILAIAISCLGLFGLASYMTEQRAKEISIRKVLGASISQLCELITTEVALLVAVSSCIAMPLTWLFMDRWLTQYNYRFYPGAGTFIWIIAAAFAIALSTVSIQALRSALRNPTDSLKSQ